MSKSICCIPGCGNSPRKINKKEKTIQFYRFPRRPWLQDRRRIWIDFAKRTNKDGTPWNPSIHTTICSEHFVGGIKSEDPRHPSYNPTIYDPKKGPKEDPKILMARYQRVFARWNRQREESASLEKASLGTSKRARSCNKTVKVTSSSSLSPVIRGDYSNPGTPMEMDDIDACDNDGPSTPSPSVIASPKQLLCLICCDYCPPECYKAYNNNVSFMSLCNILYPSVPEGNVFLNALKSLGYLSICANCQSLANSTSTTKVAVHKVSSKVEELQQQLLNEFKILQQSLGEFQKEMKKIQKCVRNSKEKILQNYLKGDGNSIKQTAGVGNNSNAILNFRRKLVQKVDNLEVFGRQIQKKVDCDSNKKDGNFQNPTLKEKSNDSSNKTDNQLGSLEVIQPSPVPQSMDGDDDPFDDSTSCLSEPSQNAPTPPIENTKNPAFPSNSGSEPNPKVIIEHIRDRVETKTTFPPPSEPPLPPKPKIKRNLMPCPVCKTRIKPINLPFHRQYACSIKTKTPSSPQHLCHLCSKTFRIPSLLESHIKIVHCEDRPFLCTQCPKACKTMQNLKIHEQSHSEERPFVCRNGCGGGFKNNKNRLRHESMCNGKGTPFRKKAKQVAPPTQPAIIANQQPELSSASAIDLL